MDFPETFKALSGPIRREILVMLKDDKMSAGDIQSNYSISPFYTKKADLIIKTKFKNFIYYEINVSVF